MSFKLEDVGQNTIAKQELLKCTTAKSGFQGVTLNKPSKKTKNKQTHRTNTQTQNIKQQ